jgi:carboxylesterase
VSREREIEAPPGGWPVLAGAEPLSLPGAAGQRTAVLVLHGFTGSPSSVRPVARALGEAGYAVRVPLLPGHGTHWRDLNRSGWDEWTAAATAELHAVRAGADRVVVVGHSNGGALALYLAEREPEAVTGLVLINPAISLADRRLIALPLLRRVQSSVPGVAGDVAREGVTVVGYDRTPLTALASMLRGWRGVRAELPAVRCPLLVLRSRVDHVVDPAGVRTLLQRVSSSDREVVVLERSFHEAPVDHDGPEVAARTTQFVARLAARPGAGRADEAG